MTRIGNSLEVGNVAFKITFRFQESYGRGHSRISQGRGWILRPPVKFEEKVFNCTHLISYMDNHVTFRWCEVCHMKTMWTGKKMAPGVKAVGEGLKTTAHAVGTRPRCSGGRWGCRLRRDL